MNIKIAFTLLKSHALRGILGEEYRPVYSEEEDPNFFIRKYARATLSALALHGEENVVSKQFKRTVSISELFNGKYVAMRLPTDEDMQVWSVKKKSEETIDYLLFEDKDGTFKMIPGGEVIAEIQLKCCVGAVEGFVACPDFHGGITDQILLSYTTKLPQDFEVSDKKVTYLKKTVSFKGVFSAAWFLYSVVAVVYIIAILIDMLGYNI